MVIHFTVRHAVRACPLGIPDWCGFIMVDRSELIDRRTLAFHADIKVIATPALLLLSVSLFSIIFWRAFYFIVLRPSRIHCRFHSSFQVQLRRPLAKFDVSLVKDSLRRNVFFWHAIRVPEFTLSVIQDSYRLLFGAIPFRNVLKNNMVSSKIRRGSLYRVLAFVSGSQKFKLLLMW